MTALTENHNRVLCSTLNVIERSLDDMISILNSKGKITYEILPDLDINSTDLLIKLKKLKQFLQDFTSKYPIKKEKISLKKLLNSKKSIWTIYLEEIKLKEIQKKYSIETNLPEYDKDLNYLIDYIKSI